ncbi:MAG: hypothetical protein F6K21_24835 [Symploca sp. SIO2D2]|nr:hypothetical protein [Symploca sp. SIO2D2]
MSTYVASTQAFIDLFKTGIISLPSLEEVYEQTRHLKDNEDITNGIEAWLKSQNNSELLKAYQNKLQQFRSGNSLTGAGDIGPGNSQSQTDPGEPNPTSRELFDNIIVKNKPLNKDSSAQSKPNP